MGQLRAAAGGAFAEVALLQEKNIVTACRRVNGNPYTRGSAADNNHVPCLWVRLDASQHVGSVHGLTLERALRFVVGSNNVRRSNDGCADAAGDQRAQDWYQRITPIRISFTANRE